MITLEDYLGPWLSSADFTAQRKDNATELLQRVNALMIYMQSRGVVFAVNPSTNNCISGRINGGFREQSCTTGAFNSAHKQAQAVDLFDPHGAIDEWLLSNPSALVDFDLYIEHPKSTPGWSHLSTRSPRSGLRIFYP
jgi:hypothetical protein